MKIEESFSPGEWTRRVGEFQLSISFAMVDLLIRIASAEAFAIRATIETRTYQHASC